MSYYVKPSSDIFIKYLFGTEENKPILLAFINAVLIKTDFDPIVSVEIVNPFNIKEFIHDKETVLDVKATDNNGRIYDIEVQSIGNSVFIHRSLYYWSVLYSSQLQENEQYHLLKPAICINILDFIIFENISDYHNCFLLKERLSNQILTDHLVINYLELPKLLDFMPDDHLKSILYFLKNEGKEDAMLKTLIKNDPIINKAHNEYVKFTQDDKMRDLYESRIKYQRDKNSLIYEAELKGKLEGVLEGKLEGKLEDARLMKEDGISVEKISKYTGLSSEVISKI